MGWSRLEFAGLQGVLNEICCYLQVVLWELGERGGGPISASGGSCPCVGCVVYLGSLLQDLVRNYRREAVFPLGLGLHSVGLV